MLVLGRGVGAGGQAAAAVPQVAPSPLLPVGVLGQGVVQGHLVAPQQQWLVLLHGGVGVAGGGREGHGVAGIGGGDLEGGRGQRVVEVHWGEAGGRGQGRHVPAERERGREKGGLVPGR